MKKETKYKLLILSVIILALLNISTIATIIIGNRNLDQDDSIVIDPESSPINGRFLRQELSFSEEQMEFFRQESREFRQKANDVISKMNLYKSELYKEIHSINPDPQKIRTYSDSIGFKHARLKEYTSEFYLEIRERCDSTQRERLRTIFEPLFRDNHQMRGPGEGRGAGGRGQAGRGSNGHRPD